MSAPPTAQLRIDGLELAKRGVAMFHNPNTNQFGIAGLPSNATEHLMVAWMGGWSAEWARLAFPTLQLSHKYAAALMCTSAPEIEVRPPWPYYLINVPDRLIAIKDGNGRDDYVERLLCMHLGERWSFTAFGQRCELRQWHRTLEFMRAGEMDGRETMQVIDGKPVPEQPESRMAGLPIESQDERANLCICRLLINSSLAMSDPRNVRIVSVGLLRPDKGNRRVPPARTFELARPVSVDCRSEVREYITGTGAHHRGSKLRTVTWLVRGHWRHQAHGPERSMRTLRWIEPFWKGADAEPLIRPHIVKGDTHDQ